jgi:hypothetical protein
VNSQFCCSHDSQILSITSSQSHTHWIAQLEEESAARVQTICTQRECMCVCVCVYMYIYDEGNVWKLLFELSNWNQFFFFLFFNLKEQTIKESWFPNKTTEGTTLQR